jgi:hypothetical protein
MLLEEKIENGIKKFLIKCDSCQHTQWYTGGKCKYGRRKFCSRSCINKGREKPAHVREKLSSMFVGSGNPFYGKSHSEENKKIMREAGIAAWDTHKARLGNHFADWFDEFCQNQRGKQNGFYGKTHSTESRAQMSETKAKLISEGKITLKGHRGIKGWFYSTKMQQQFYYDSFYELLRMKMLDADDNIVSWTKRHGIRIPYMLSEQNKYYVPDFLIEEVNANKKVIEEVKGYEPPQKKYLKYAALNKFASGNNMLWRRIEYAELNIMCQKFFGKSYQVMYGRRGICWQSPCRCPNGSRP